MIGTHSYLCRYWDMRTIDRLPKPDKRYTKMNVAIMIEIAADSLEANSRRRVACVHREVRWNYLRETKPSCCRRRETTSEWIRGKREVLLTG